MKNKNRIYKEVLAYFDYKNSYKIIGKNGTTIEKKNLNNHIKGMQSITADGKQHPMPTHDYLVFTCPKIKDEAFLIDLRLSYQHFLTIGHTENETILSCHHPQIYSTSILLELQKQKLIKFTWKEFGGDDFPAYINATGWQLLFNIGSAILTGVRYLFRKLKKKISKQ